MRTVMTLVVVAAQVIGLAAAACAAARPPELALRAATQSRAPAAALRERSTAAFAGERAELPRIPALRPALDPAPRVRGLALPAASARWRNPPTPPSILRI